MSLSTDESLAPLRATLLTPPGPGGIAVIQLVGEGAFDALDGCFSSPVLDAQRAIKNTEGGRVRRCWFLDEGERIDEVLARRLDDPLGVEICCHGGLAPASRILQALENRGAVRARSWEAHGLSPLRAAAWSALLATRSELGAKVFLREIHEGLEARVVQWVNECRGGSVSEGLVSDVRAVLSRGASGLALAHPPRVALVGAANAGKSTLFNAWVGRERAMTSPVAGTTRDPLSARIRVLGYELELWDTAGLEEGPEVSELSRAAFALGESATAGAAAIIEVVDGTEEPGECRPGRLVVRNKCDDVRFRSGPGVSCSALRSEGLGDIEEALAEMLGLRSESELEGPVPFRVIDCQALEEFLSARQDPVRAGRILHSIPSARTGTC